MRDIDRVEHILHNYRDDLTSLFIKLQNPKGQDNIHFVLTRVMYTIVPEIMRDVNKAGLENTYNLKGMIVDTLVSTMDSLYKDMNLSSYISEDVWSSVFVTAVKEMVPADIEMITSISNGHMKIRANKPCIIL